MVTLDDLKLHLNITTDQDDVLLAAKLAAAQEFAVAYTSIPADGSNQAGYDEAVRQIAAYLYDAREGTPGIPQSVLDRDQSFCKQVQFIHALGVA